jgi:curved DNA-binding protein CbpA
VSKNGFVDYYELLQLSSNADTDTIERVFRHLAKKLHPDNKESADPDRFRLVVEAHRTLSNPESRAGYDVKYQEYWDSKWKLASEVSNGTAFSDDRETRESLLSLLYVQRRRDTRHPGLSDFDMARLLGKPFELVEFHVWYLKAKGWVERLDTGQLAISAVGVDQVEKNRLRLRNDNLLAAPEGAEEQAAHSGTAELLVFQKKPDFDQ